jgi:hypothetical protein
MAAAAQLGDSQLNGSGTGLQQPIAVGVAVIDALRAAFAVRGAGETLEGQAACVLLALVAILRELVWRREGQAMLDNSLGWR